MPLLILATLVLILDLEEFIYYFLLLFEWSIHATKLLLGISTAFFLEDDDISSAYFCHNKTKGSISKQSSHTSNSPLALMWFPFPVWLVCVALVELFTAP